MRMESEHAGPNVTEGSRRERHQGKRQQHEKRKAECSLREILQKTGLAERLNDPDQALAHWSTKSARKRNFKRVACTDLLSGGSYKKQSR